MIDQVYSFDETKIDKWIKIKNKKDSNGKLIDDKKLSKWKNLTKAFLVIKHLGKHNDIYEDQISTYEFQIFKTICKYKTKNNDYGTMEDRFQKFLNGYNKRKIELNYKVLDFKGVQITEGKFCLL